MLSTKMDADMWQTRLLKSDNNKMFADLNVWRNKNGFGENLEGTEWGDIGGEPVADYFESDRHMECKTNDEMELDDKNKGREVRSALKSELAVRAKSEKTGAQLPSATGSDE